MAALVSVFGFVALRLLLMIILNKIFPEYYITAEDGDIDTIYGLPSVLIP